MDESASGLTKRSKPLSLRCRVRYLAPRLERPRICELRPHPTPIAPHLRRIDLKHLVKAVRWTVALPAAFLAASAVWFVASAGLDAFGVEFPDWRFFLVMAYAYMAAGFVFAGTATKLAPGRRTTVAMSMIGIALAGALILVLRGDHGLAASLVFGLSLLAGAVGYSLRLRGFSDVLAAEA